jgi:hypothetical protein
VNGWEDECAAATESEPQTAKAPSTLGLPRLAALRALNPRALAVLESPGFAERAGPFQSHPRYRFRTATATATASAQRPLLHRNEARALIAHGL